MTALETLFKDLVVVEVANVLAGPAVGMFFAELGAKVIKVENPSTRGDTTRQWKLPTEPAGSDISGYFSCVNWGKQSIGIDFLHPEGQGVLGDLIKTSDIFLQSFKTGDDLKFQLDYPTLKKINSQLIYADISAYGQDDERTGFDAVIQAETGFTGINGTMDSGPIKMPVALIDLLLAHQLKEALLLALIERLQSGKGSYVTISLFQAGVSTLANQATNFLVGKTIPQRTGSDHPNIVPYGTVFLTKQGEGIVLAVGTDAQFQALCFALNRPDLAKDDRFSTNPLRVKHRELLNATLTECIGTWDRKKLLEDLHSRRVPAGGVRTLDEVFDHPSTDPLLMAGQLADGRPIEGLRTIAFDSTCINQVRQMGVPPTYNEHGRSILKDHLHYSDDQINRLFDKNVIG